MIDVNNISYIVSPKISNRDINDLFRTAWRNHEETDFSYLTRCSLGYICAYFNNIIIGFVNIAWDGNRHAFILDTTVRKECQKKGIGKKLMEKAINLAKSNGVEWVHVDYEQEYESFYQSCGFTDAPAGLVHLFEDERRVT